MQHRTAVVLICPAFANSQSHALLPALPILELARLEADFLPLLNEVPDPVAQVPRVHAGTKWLVGLVHRCAQLLQQAVDAPQLPTQRIVTWLVPGSLANQEPVNLACQRLSPRICGHVLEL